MLTEMRRYAIKPGCMDQMHARMSGLLMPLFKAHGIPKPLAIWETTEPAPVLTWMVQWSSFEERLDAWTRFAPVFVAARLAEGTPEIVTRTTLTVISPWPDASFGFSAPATGCETAWHIQPQIGFGAAFMTGCKESAFDRFRAAGAIGVEACNLLFGALPQALVLLRWPDAATRTAGMAQIAELELQNPFPEALVGSGARFGDRGQWERLDRARYLEA